MNLAHRLEDFLDLKLFRKGFSVLSIGLLPFVLVDGLWISLQRIPQGSNPLSSFDAMGEKKVLEPLSFYESIFDKDTWLGRVSTTSGETILKTPIAELIKDYRLKGVVLAGEPEAIIEDARTQKTSFLKVGEKLEDLEIKKIEEGRVVIVYGDEEKTLEIQ